MENQIEVIRLLSKYVFIDVVQFSRRSVEAQSDIVKTFNKIVHEVLKEHNVDRNNVDDCILIPTGDGMCISLISQKLPYDIDIKIALAILKLISKHNNEPQKEGRKFDVRIGINQNKDILVEDVNGRRNVAGAGINLASRIMDKADGGQILVSQAIHHELNPNEIYMDKFKKFDATGKHNIHFEVYQYILENTDGLNIDVPKSLEESKKIEEKFPKQIAYFIGFLIRNRNLFVINKASLSYQMDLKLVCWLLSNDTVKKDEASEVDHPSYYTYKFEEATVEEQVQYYKEIDHKFLLAFRKEIDRFLLAFSQYFDGYNMYIFVTDYAKEKLKSEWEEIWKDLELDNYV